MKTLVTFTLVFGIVLGWGVRQGVAQQHIPAEFTLSGGSLIVVVSEDSLTKLLTQHDRLFISLGIRRDFFWRNNPLNRGDRPHAVVLEARRFRIEEAELDRAIERLGRLIREMDKEEAGK